MRYFALIVLLLSTSLWAAPEFPALSGRVVDEAGLLTPAQTQSLTQALAAAEQNTSQSAGGGYLARFAGLRHCRLWLSTGP